jgi:hypothetical protein
MASKRIKPHVHFTSEIETASDTAHHRNAMSDTLKWEVRAGCPGTDVVQYCANTDEALDFCGRLLYANSLFSLLLLRVRRVEANQPEFLGDEFSVGLKRSTEWVMRIAESSGGFRERQLASKHELFAMLIAELRLGCTQLEVRHISNVCKKEWGEGDGTNG